MGVEAAARLPHGHTHALHGEWRCRAPNLGSNVHHVSVPGSVSDTYNSNKIDIKNHTFITNREIYYMVRVA
jgi:hypothetical protein